MDKPWMGKSRLSKEYDLGVEMFIKFGELHANGSNSIRCPCLKCVNCVYRSSQDIRDHLYIHGIDQSYKKWFWHGEELSNKFKDEEVGDNMDEPLDKENEDNVMDKSWMGKSRLSKEYDLGVEMFIKFGERHAKGSTFIRCPCLKCGNRVPRSSRDIRDHLYIHGIDQSYKTWFWHGEELSDELEGKEVGENMDNSLEEESEGDELDNITEMVKAAHATNPLMSGCNQNTPKTSYMKLDCNKKRVRGPTTMREITRCSSQGDRKVVEYNDYGQQIGVNGAKLKSYIGSCVHYHVPITYSTWKHVPNGTEEKIFKLIQAGFVIDAGSKKSILQAAGNSFRQFKSRLTTHFIIPFKDQPHRLENPPDTYSHIESHHWRQFVKYRLSEEFENMRTLQVQRRAKNKYNHRLSRKGYANLIEELKKSSCSKKAARMNKKRREMENRDTEEDESLKDVDIKRKVTMNKNPSCDYVSTRRASGRSESSDRVKGEGGLSKPSAGFHTTKLAPKRERTQEKEDEEEMKKPAPKRERTQEKEDEEEIKMLYRRIKELEEQIRLKQIPPISEHGSCDEQHSDEEILGPANNWNFKKEN